MLKGKDREKTTKLVRPILRKKGKAGSTWQICRGARSPHHQSAGGREEKESPKKKTAFLNLRDLRRETNNKEEGKRSWQSQLWSRGGRLFGKKVGVGPARRG